VNDSDTTEIKNCAKTLATMANGAALRFTAAERSKGRFMRAPDGHDAGADAGGGAGGSEAAASGSETVGQGAAPLDDAAAVAAADGGTDTGVVAGGDSQDGKDPLDAPGILDDAEKAKVDAKEGEDGKGGEAGKDGDAAPLVGEAPEAYELTPPEGFTIDKTSLDVFDPVFRELGLTKEGAQKVVDAAPAFVEHITNQVQNAQVQQIVDTRKQWADAALADPEIGGANLDRSKQYAASVFDRYGLKPDGPFRTLLNESGLANHPDMIRVFAKIGHDMGEDGFPVGEGAPRVPSSRVERMYPDDQPKTA